MKLKTISLFIFLCSLYPELLIAQIGGDDTDVLHYHVTLEPNIPERSIEGNVHITFTTDGIRNQVTFDCGNLTIDKVEGQFVQSFVQEDQKLIIHFSKPLEGEQQLHIFYQGTPTRGVVFSTEPLQMYTVYFTHEWMVCHDQPHDRASIRMDVIVPAELTCIATGTWTGKQEVKDNKVMYSWHQQVATPPYTYGFAIGPFTKISEEVQGRRFDYYSAQHDSAELSTIFTSSADILHFFEEKSGVSYFQSSYSQVLIGNHYQEMSGFAVLKDSYGDMILKDSTEINLIAHELAHQWWGNMITCQDLGHFWLNEAFATFMSAAYNEKRFGRDKYMQNISAYEEVYDKIKAKGSDKPLVFESWTHPTADDRNLVYFKGAYVLHKLREALGDEKFWKGIKSYSQQFYGKSVVTQDFQQAMEKATQKDLTAFFDEWVY